MNLAAYDKVNNIFEDNWINFQYNRFYSRSIKYRRFFFKISAEDFLPSDKTLEFLE